jgi:hypothetical protein
MFYLVFFVCKVKKNILISQVFLKIKQGKLIISKKMHAAATFLLRVTSKS